MTLGIAGVGTLFFAREVSAGVVAALQMALLADVGLVAFALAMTAFLPRSPAATLGEGRVGLEAAQELA